MQIYESIPYSAPIILHTLIYPLLVIIPSVFLYIHSLCLPKNIDSLLSPKNIDSLYLPKTLILFISKVRTGTVR